MSAPQSDYPRLFHALAQISDETECRSVFQDLCSATELRAMNQRFEVAALLLEGETFLSIQQKLNVSSTIVARVNRALQHSSGGLRSLMEKSE